MKKLLFIFMALLFMSAAQAQNKNISGIVFWDSTVTVQPNDTLKLWLITFNSQTNILSAVDSIIISGTQGQGNAAYIFNGAAPGSYRIKAALLNGPTTGTSLLPTYYNANSSPVLWSNATVINHTNTQHTMGIIIHMAVGTATSGPGFIGGNVSQGANKGTANGIAGMTILLMDMNDNPVKHVVTDANGDYSISDLPYGSYKIYPENPGDATTPAQITLDVNTPSAGNIHFERSNSGQTIKPIAVGIGSISSAPGLNIYPNPATDVININWSNLSDDAATVNITDISGKKVYQSEVKMDANAVINISNIQSGFYFLNIATESGSNTQKLLIQ